MAEEGLPPQEATRKAMRQITGAIIGITLVLMAVFVPMAFFPGSVGIIYRQFSRHHGVGRSLFSALPGAVADAGAVRHASSSRSKPATATRARACSAGSTAAGFAAATAIRARWRGSLKRTGRLMLIYRGAADRARLGLRPAARRLPAGRRPGLHHRRRADAAGARPIAPHRGCRRGRREVSAQSQPASSDVTFLTGFSFLGQGQNTAQAFVTLKDWRERGPKDSAAAIVADINRDLSSIRDANISALQPPPIDNLGNSSRLLASGCRTAARKAMPALVAAARPADRAKPSRAACCRRSMSRACRRRRRSI